MLVGNDQLRIVWTVLATSAAFVVGLTIGVLPVWLLALPPVCVLGIVLVGALRRAGRGKRKSTMERLPLAGAGLTVELVLLPLAVSIRQVTWLTAGLMLILVAFSILRRRSSSTALGIAPLVLILFCVGTVCWRVVEQDSSDSWRLATIIGLFVTATFVIVVSGTAVGRQAAYASLLAGLSLYLIGNIVGWIVGIRSASSDVRVGGYETSDGIFGLRVFFPFARAINEPSYVAATLIAGVVALVAVGDKPRWFHWVGVASGLLVMLASNSRSPLLFLAPVVLLLFVAPRLLRAASTPIVAIALLLPFLLNPLRPVISSIAGVLATNDYLSRGQNASDIGGLGTRDVIWSRSVDFWHTHVVDSPHQLFGYGYNGHSVSGALDTYVSGIGNFLSVRSALTMHNSILQTLFDAGLVGASCLFVAIVIVLYRFSRSPDDLPMLAVAVMTASSGIAEICLAPGLNQTPIFILIYLAALSPSTRVWRRARDSDIKDSNDLLPSMPAVV